MSLLLIVIVIRNRNPFSLFAKPEEIAITN